MPAKKASSPVRTPSPPASPVGKKGSSVDEKDKAIDATVVYEFGGPVGALLIMIFSPVIMYYTWICIEFYGGTLAHPDGFLDVFPWVGRMWGHFLDRASPTWYATKVYLLYVLFQYVAAYVLPGPVVKGLPVPSLGNVQLEYLCNGVTAWYATVVAAVVLHFSGVFRIQSIVDNFGPLMTVAIIFGNFVTLVTYFSAIVLKKQHRMSGNFFYDIFMGAWLNPRLGKIDLKLWAEIRVPWTILFWISVSAAAKEYELRGYVGAPLLFMCLAHFLYVNACHKGEECIPTTWDIFYEKWGFMLIYWNLAGVPFTYCHSSLYLLKHGPVEHPTWFIIFLYVTLLLAYYVWDTANSQKNRFRMQLRGTYIPRNTFPQLPWGTLHNPKYIKTKNGGTLLTDGWWGIARKIHYTADLYMALSWGMICGFNVFLPFFYFCFFLGVLTHRVTRDMERCAKKYGDDWKEYCRRVPYIFIPYVY
eukprot:TRINITY_DN3029_c0_g1_i1.p1 TRINITY_DN3029_c0_g1~~TRINITY_DN3029_c0_g1_i1.p1  ORF type:complete len:481 (+),score=102.93 TRINITY_DN3029_c0_g1_i1:27-1445(+)